MNEKAIKIILYVTGIVTMMPGLQFLAPILFLQSSGMQVGDATGLFFARHWGLVVFCLGALLVYVAKRPALRRPVMFAAAIEKLGLVAMVLMSWQDPALKGLHIAAGFDTLCIILYAAYLLRKPI
ncbi:hypothetical protein [Undibacterium sp.]|jgi:hypothetical protein|uniref:hypothetical protein n=1 Tax=Undibacterium sp. TaxID=1914977 RepID=UPI002BA34D6D|nr:hypothetical protein [Undibacterium sp.]HTD06159.1 hypothetical protein [Undibacterium sp.]